MTKAEAIRQLKKQMIPNAPIASMEAILMAIAALQKENEPASPKGNTSSENQKDYICKNNDSTEKKKCQEAICQAIDNMITIYERMSPEEQNAWDLGEVYKRVLDVQRMIEEDKK